MTEKKKYALIVAGGLGTRMQQSIPKQFLLLHSKPILMHTIEKFVLCDDIILVLPELEVAYWKNLCQQFQFNIPHQIVSGGATRFESVQNGLKLVQPDSLVAIHDGVRPCIDQDVIKRSFECASVKGCSIAVVKLKDSIRKQVGESPSIALDRSEYYLVQTPQTFQSNLIIGAYEQKYQPVFTDDASVFEANGGTVFFTDGSYSNIKITTPEDLLFAEALLKP